MERFHNFGLRCGHGDGGDQLPRRTRRPGRGGVAGGGGLRPSCTIEDSTSPEVCDVLR